MSDSLAVCLPAVAKAIAIHFNDDILHKRLLLHTSFHNLGLLSMLYTDIGKGKNKKLLFPSKFWSE